MTNRRRSIAVVGPSSHAGCRPCRSSSFDRILLLFVSLPRAVFRRFQQVSYVKAGFRQRVVDIVERVFLTGVIRLMDTVVRLDVDRFGSQNFRFLGLHQDGIQTSNLSCAGPFRQRQWRVVRSSRLVARPTETAKIDHSFPSSSEAPVRRLKYSSRNNLYRYVS